MRVSRRSPVSGLVNVREIPVTPEQIARWNSGELIQRAMPDLSAGDREFLMSGITPEEWSLLFQQVED